MHTFHGKAIISGEYSVLFGQPALAMPVPLCCHTAICANPNERGIRWHVRHADQINREPLFACVEDLAADVDITIKSTIPVGCGFGSSAAVILSLLSASAAFQKKTWTEDGLFEKAKAIENLVHGRSSGLDIMTSLWHCGTYYDGSGFQKMPHTPELFLIDTGTPDCTTKSCVTSVLQRFAQSDIWSEFGDITRLVMRDVKAIRLNHQLLVRLGVVPVKVQNFIAAIEALGGAAKISGAGAIYGEHAGLVIATCAPMALIEQYGYHHLAFASPTPLLYT